MEFAKTLDRIAVVYQANYRRDPSGRPERLFLAIYDLPSQRRLLEACGDELDEDRRAALDTLVRARGSVPDQLVRKISESSEFGRSDAYIAQKLNQQLIPDGMGGKGWTAKKVRAALAKYDPRAGRREVAA